MKKEDMEEKLNQDPDNGVNTFILTDEDGNDFEFELLDFVDLDERLYAVLIPAGDESADEGVVIMETEFEGEDPVFTFVEDEDLAQRVLDAYVNQIAEEEEVPETDE